MNKKRSDRYPASTADQANQQTTRTMDVINLTKIPTLMLVLLLLTQHAAYAQTFTKTNYGAQGGSLFYNIDPMEEERDGSPYLSDEWRKGTVYNSNKTFAELEQMKYNIHKDELIFLHKGVQYLVPEKHLIERFTLDNQDFARGFDGRKTAFYLVVQPGNQLSLVKKLSCNLVKGSPSKGYIPATKDRYEMKEIYYLMLSNNDVVMINPKKGNELLSLVRHKSDQLEDFIRTNKLKMKSIEDLSKVLTYYNSLFP